MKKILFLLLITHYSLAQNIDAIQKQLDSLQKEKTKLLAIETPKKIAIIRKLIDSLRKEDDRILATSKEIEDKIKISENEIQSLNYKLETTSSTEVISSLEIPLYTQPDVSEYVRESIPVNSKFIVIDFIDKTTMKFAKVNYNGREAYVNMLALESFTNFDYVKSGFSEKPGDVINKANTQSDTKTYIPSNSYSGSHSYNVGRRGGVYYINSNGNKTYKKRN